MESRARLLQAAFVLVAERGFANFAVGEVTEAADVGLGTFYNHFSSKEEIHKALLENLIGDLDLAMEGAKGSADSPAACVKAYISQILRRANDDSHWSMFISNLGPYQVEIIEHLDASLRRLAGDPTNTAQAPDVTAPGKFIVVSCAVLGMLIRFGAGRSVCGNLPTCAPDSALVDKATTELLRIVAES
ncbi:TetR/AcrR family transcriptional regulator [Oleomonas cavernae]|nr:TetR/AcrR family transcriptional regulator [Oleomonas cavernae]